MNTAESNLKVTSGGIVVGFTNCFIAGAPRGLFVILSVSRVLSWTVIYLRLTSPPSFGLRRATRGYVSGRRSSYGVASNRVYSGPMLP